MWEPQVVSSVPHVTIGLEDGSWKRKELAEIGEDTVTITLERGEIRHVTVVVVRTVEAHHPEGRISSSLELRRSCIAARDGQARLHTALSYFSKSIYPDLSGVPVSVGVGKGL